MSHDQQKPSKDSPASGQSMPLVDSARLFNGREEILIIHGSETYRLRRTRQGKLILTK